MSSGKVSREIIDRMMLIGLDRVAKRNAFDSHIPSAGPPEADLQVPPVLCFQGDGRTPAVAVTGPPREGPVSRARQVTLPSSHVLT